MKLNEEPKSLAEVIITMAPGGIERSEKRAQQEMVNHPVLPLKLDPSREAFEKLGVVFGEQVNSLFQKSTLPDGWKIVPTDHAMWSHLLDAKGRTRAKIFYKCAFYDQSSKAHLVCRYSYDYVYDEVTFEALRTKLTDACGIEEYSIEGDKPGEMTRYLREKYPDYRDPLAYWD